MPIVTLEGPRIQDLNARRALVETVTAAAAQAYGLPPEKIVILLHENSPEQVAVGGQLLVDRR